MVLGRNVALLFAGFLFIWLVFTKATDKTVKYSAIAVVLVLAAGFAASIRSIENTGNNGLRLPLPLGTDSGSTTVGVSQIQQGRCSQTARSMHLPPRFTDFLGPNRDGIVPGVKLITDLTMSAPKELWRRPGRWWLREFVFSLVAWLSPSNNAAKKR
jgi:hypothetical protein